MRTDRIDAINRTFLAHFKHKAIYADGDFPELGVESCGFPGAVDQVSAMRRRHECVYGRALAKFDLLGIRYYIFTAHDVWWNVLALPRFLDAIARTLPFDTNVSVPIVTGGGGALGPRASVYSSFAILNAEALRPLADTSILETCKKDLKSRNPWARWVASDGLYRTDHLLSYCADHPKRPRGNVVARETFWCASPSAVKGGNFRFHANIRHQEYGALLDQWNPGTVSLDNMPRVNARNFDVAATDEFHYCARHLRMTCGARAAALSLVVALAHLNASAIDSINQDATVVRECAARQPRVRACISGALPGIPLHPNCRGDVSQNPAALRRKEKGWRSQRYVPLDVWFQH